MTRFHAVIRFERIRTYFFHAEEGKEESFITSLLIVSATGPNVSTFKYKRF